jgi:hypothetical protein
MLRPRTSVDAHIHNRRVLAHIPVTRRLNNGFSKRLGVGIYTIIVGPLVADNGIGEQMKAVACVLFATPYACLLTVFASIGPDFGEGAPPAIEWNPAGWQGFGDWLVAYTQHALGESSPYIVTEASADIP